MLGRRGSHCATSHVNRHSADVMLYDLAGSMVGALVSTAMAWQKYGNDTAYVSSLMQGARTLYAEARKYEGSFGSRFK